MKMIHLSRSFYFDKEAVRIVYINENGVISFNSRYNVRTPLSLPLSGTQTIIAPYWADVDTRGTGQIYYRQSSDPNLLARASREIRRNFSLIYDIKSVLIVTWNAVGYFRKHIDKVNTFQCVLATSETESFIIFLYADLQWTTGDKSYGRGGLGGIEALAGYNAGDQINFYTLVGSLTSNITNIAKISNVGIPGRWIFKLGEAYDVKIKIFPDGSPVNGNSSILEYPVGSRLFLICGVTPTQPSNSEFSWSCKTGCFADKETKPIISTSNFTTMDSGLIICSLTINNLKYHSKPLHLQVV